MENREATMMEVLDFREHKADIQKIMSISCPEAIVVSLGINIPGPVKSGSSIFAYFKKEKRLQQVILKEEGIQASDLVTSHERG